jgi:hypothetical protein
MTETEAEFNKRLDLENMKYWAERGPKLKKDIKREHQGIWYLGLSIVSIIGGFAGMLYGLAGKDWVQKPYVMMSAVLILFGLSIVIGGFGRVKE